MHKLILVVGYFVVLCFLSILSVAAALPNAEKKKAEEQVLVPAEPRQPDLKNLEKRVEFLEDLALDQQRQIHELTRALRTMNDTREVDQILKDLKKSEEKLRKVLPKQRSGSDILKDYFPKEDCPPPTHEPTPKIPAPPRSSVPSPVDHQVEA